MSSLHANRRKPAAALTAATPPRRHIAGLDGLRALAAGLVLVYHFWALSKIPLPRPLEVVVQTGWVGVDIFFVISGFILFLPWARAGWTGGRVATRRFLENRLLRIVPAYWFNLVLLVVVMKSSLLFSVEGLGKIFLNAAFLTGYAPPGTSGLLINPVAWTLCIEMTFYLLLPLIARFFVRNRWLVALPVVLLATALFKLVAIARYEDVDVRVLHSALSTIAGTLNEFAVGMSVAAVWAWCEHRNVRLPAWVGPTCTVAGLGGMWAILWFLQLGIGHEEYRSGTGDHGWFPLLTLRPVLAFFVAAALFGICYQANVVTRFLSLRPIAYLGVVSYGIYLWHLPVGQWLSHGIGPEASPLRRLILLLTVGTAITLLWSAFSDRFVEKPFLQRKRSSGGVPQAPAASGPLPTERAAGDLPTTTPSLTAVIPAARSREMAGT
jgi:peptidoglycan/LPS O-acetylase OafA/YrhL